MNLQRWALGILLLSSPSWGGASLPVPVGGQFQINAYTQSIQTRPAISNEYDGDFVVVWQSFGSSGGDSSMESIQGQRYAADGVPVAGQFQVNTYTTSFQTSPAVALDADGDFVVVWQSYGSLDGDNSYASIQGQRYAADGGALGGQFEVNAYTTSYQVSPRVALDADGDFVVVWQSNGSAGGDISNFSIHGQRFAASGAGLGGEFQVNAYTTNFQQMPALALDADGDSVVVWESNGSSGGDTSFTSIQGQRYAADGATLGGEFEVNAETTSFQLLAAVAMTAGGDFVVVWQSYASSGSDSPSYSIQGQRFAAAGVPLGGQFQVNTYITSQQTSPAVALDADGDFVVVWQSDGSSGGDTSLYSIQGQRFAADGAPLGGEFQVNSYTTSTQNFPAVALAADGDFVVAWQSNGASAGDTSSFSIQGQRYRVTGDLQGKVFFDDDADGLQGGGESGIPGITVELYDELLHLRRTALTDAAGEYRLQPKEGTWHLRFVAPPAWFTSPDVGGDDTVDSDAQPATGETAPFPVTVNVLDATIDAGLVVFPLFVDGFESTDTSRWSATVP